MNKTRKNNKKTIKNSIKKDVYAICVLHKNKNNVSGYIKFKQVKNRVKVSYEIKGLSDGFKKNGSISAEK